MMTVLHDATIHDMQYPWQHMHMTGNPTLLICWQAGTTCKCCLILVTIPVATSCIHACSHASTRNMLYHIPTHICSPFYKLALVRQLLGSPMHARLWFTCNHTCGHHFEAICSGPMWCNRRSYSQCVVRDTSTSMQ